MIIIIIFFFFAFLFLFCPRKLKWLSSLYIFPFSISFPSSALILWVVAICSFFLLMFLPYYCFNNVKTQVLACSLWLVPICFSCSIFLAAVLYPFLPLVFWYLIADAKPSINCRLLERIA